MFARRPAQPGSSEEEEEEDAAAIGDTSPAQAQQPQQETQLLQQQRRMSQGKAGQRAGSGPEAGLQGVTKGQGSDESVGQAAVDDLDDGELGCCPQFGGRDALLH